MGTTPIPTPVAPFSPPSVSWLTTWAAFIKAHERLLIIVLASLLLFKAGQGIENIILKYDQKNANQAATVVQQDTSVNAESQKVLAQIKSDAETQKKKIDQTIANAKSALAIQQKKDAASTPSQIDSRWEGLLPLKPNSVIPLDPATTAVTNDAASQTVQALEEIPILTTQVVNLTTELSNDQKIIVQQDNTIIGLNKEIIDVKSQDIADVKLAKAQGKKSFWHGFKIGLIVGAVGVEAVRVWAGHP